MSSVLRSLSTRCEDCQISILKDNGGMEFNEDEQKIQKESKEYIISHSDDLIKKHIKDKNPLPIGFVTIFMAGSPGSGKTEFSERYIPLVYQKGSELDKTLNKKGINTEHYDSLIVRIDVDEIREFLPQYKKTNDKDGAKGNAHVIQAAANKGLDILRDYCLGNNVSFLHDGTFGNYKTMRDIIKKSLKDNRDVKIFYLYIDPIVAWNFTKAREKVEGRNIIKENFIKQFYASKENVDLIKKEFEKKVSVNCVLKNNKNEVEDIEFNVSSVDRYLKTMYKRGKAIDYSVEDLEEKLV